MYWRRGNRKLWVLHREINYQLRAEWGEGGLDNKQVPLAGWDASCNSS